MCSPQEESHPGASPASSSAGISSTPPRAWEPCVLDRDVRIEDAGIQVCRD